MQPTPAYLATFFKSYSACNLEFQKLKAWSIGFKLSANSVYAFL